MGGGGRSLLYRNAAAPVFDVEPDNCVDGVPNADQENADNDAFGDVCEPNQINCGVDSDGDGIGDALQIAFCDNDQRTHWQRGALLVRFRSNCDRGTFIVLAWQLQPRPGGWRWRRHR